MILVFPFFLFSSHNKTRAIATKSSKAIHRPSRLYNFVYIHHGNHQYTRTFKQFHVNGLYRFT